VQRLFVAVDLPESVKTTLGQLQFGLPGARWVNPDNLHLTLRFIGEVDNGHADDIDAALGAVHAPPFQFELEGMGLFGTRRSAHTLWVGVATCRALEALKARVDTALSGAGLRPESRKFAPHVTLARLVGAHRDDIEGFIRDHAGALLPRPSVTADSFILYSSFLSASGAIHTPEAVYPLG
jgi:2'-5' RNA ligase